MSRNKLWIAIALLQVPLCHISGQTCPLNCTKLTILDHTSANRDTSNFDIQFDGCYQRFGPSDSNGVVSYGPCTGTSSAPTKFLSSPSTVAWTLRNASFQVRLGHISGQTLPLNNGKLTILDHTSANRDTSSFDIQFGGCSQPSGTSDSNGVVSYGPCTSTPSATAKFSSDPSTVMWRLRNASFASGPSPLPAAVIQVSRNQYPSLLSPTVLAALISGLFGTFITYFLEERKFKRGRKVEQLENEQRLVRYTYRLVGRCINAGLGLIAIATPEFQSPTPEPAQLGAKEKLRVRFDATERFWNVEKYSQAVLIRFDRSDHVRIQQIWSEIDASIASYFEVCKRIFNEYRVSQTVITTQQKDAVRSGYVTRTEVALKNLTEEIVVARRSGKPLDPISSSKSPTRSATSG